MGLFSQIIGGLMGGSGNASPLQNVLMNMLMNNQQQPDPGALGQGMAGGGLNNLIARFEQAGLGNVIQSWISNGPNHPVSPDQLQSALGPEQVNTMSQQAGMEPHDFLTQLSQHLPNMVNAMTPEGKVPDEGTASV